MDSEIISLLIKWGPLAIVTIIFLWWFMWGCIRGTYKVVRRLIYVILFVVLIWAFMGQITNFVLDFKFNIGSFESVRTFIVKFIEENEAINDFLKYSPNLKGIIVDSPEIIVSPILFLVLVIVGLPLSYPIYWLIYLPIYGFIAKVIFKRKKYEVDENGDVLRNEKGKKIKVQRKKHRLLGGFLRGAQGVVLFCIALLPVNFVNRIYNKAKGKAELEKGETLCDTNSSLKDYKEICGYIDVYNESIFAKLGGEKSLDKFITDKLTTIEYNDKEISLENELSSVAISAVLLNDSGVMDLFVDGKFDLDTADFSNINFDKLSELVDYLFKSSLISEVTETGVKYVLNEVVNDDLVKLLKDDDIVSKLQYQNVNEIKQELKDIIAILKLAVEKNIVDSAIDNRKDVVTIVNNVNDEDIESLINKVLSLRILNKAMPSVIKAYGEKYGVSVPETMSDELNGEVASLFGEAVKLVHTMDLVNMDSITEGNLLDNLINALFENGALKSDTKDSLATLLNELNQSYLFKNVVEEQANKLLKDKDYKVDARVLRYVDSKEAWLKELSVLDHAYKLYDDYKKEDVIDYNNVTELLNEISQTKVIISVLPFAYDELLPKVGIELNSGELPSIEFDKENEEATKVEFYNLWESELTILKNVADAAGVLKLQSLEEIDIDLLDNEDNVNALSTIMGEIYKSELLREPLVNYMKDIINEFVSDYSVEFSKEELLALNTKDKWMNELTNINIVLNIDLSNEESINATNLYTIFSAIKSMELFKTKKVKILKVAIEESEFLTVEEFNGISWPGENATQEEIDNFFNNETDVLVNIVDKKDTVKDLANVTIETLDTEEVGELINEVMKSNILKPIVVNKVSKLLVDNDVKDDRDVGSDTTNLKNTIGGDIDWRVELASIKDMVNSIDNVITTSYHEITNANRYNRSGEEGSYAYTQNETGSYLKVEDNYYLIEDSYRYNKDGDQYVQNDEGAYLKVSTSVVSEVFTTIEGSKLLQNSRASLLLKAVETINIVEVPSDVTITRLMDNNYTLYESERDIIVDVSSNKNAFDDLSTMELADINTEEIGGLLDSVTSSVIFGDYVVDQIVTVFTSSDVRHDEDVAPSTSNLKSSVANVNDWGKELAIIKDMLNVDGTSFNEVVDGKTNVERMFDNIEASALLKNTRANLLIKAVGLINIDGVNTSNVTVNSLKAVYNDEEYYQYNKEVDVFVTFAENKSSVDNLSDITALSGEQKIKMANLLDALELSSILKVKYEETIDDAVSSVKNNQSLVDYGVTFKSANDARDVDWATEIDNLIAIKNNVATVAGYTDQDIINNRVNTISIIGATLDAVENSAFLGKDPVNPEENQANKIANKVVTELTKNLPDGYKVTSISKNEGETWSQAFDRVVQIPGLS